MSRGPRNALGKQVRGLEQQSRGIQRDIQKELQKNKQSLQTIEKLQKDIQVVATRRGHIEEQLFNIQEQNRQKMSGINELKLQLKGFKAIHSQVEEKLTRGKNLLDETRSGFLRSVEDINNQMEHGINFFEEEKIQESGARIGREMIPLQTKNTGTGRVDENELMRLKTENERIKLQLAELGDEIGRQGKASQQEMSNRNLPVNSEQEIEALRSKRNVFVGEFEKQGKVLSEFEREFDILKRDVDGAMEQLSHHNCCVCGTKLNQIDLN